MVELTPANGQTRLVSDVFADAENRNQDWWKVHNYAIAAADTAATSLAWVGTLGQWSPDSFVPEGWETYHRSRGLYDTVSSVPMMFVGVGAATKAARVGSWMDRAAERLGASDKLRAALFSDVGKVAEYDSLMAAARSTKAVGVAEATGLTTPNLQLTGMLDDGAAKLRALSGADTYEEAAQWASRFATRNSIKEGLAQEIALFATMNSSEFLYPEGASPWSYLGFGAAGVGLNISVDALVRSAAVRKTTAGAARLGAEVTAQKREAGNLLTHGDVPGAVIGDRWMTMAADAYGLERLDMLEGSVDAIVGAAGGGLSRNEILAEVGAIRKGLKASAVETVGRMFSDRINNKITLKGHKNTAAVSQQISPGTGLRADVAERLLQNKMALGGLAELGDLDYVARWETLRVKLDTELQQAKAQLRKVAGSPDLKAVRAAQDAVDTVKTAAATLHDTRPAIIEAHGVVNYNVHRQRPFWEIPGAREIKTEVGASGIKFEREGLHIGYDGQIYGADKRGLVLRQMEDLNFTQQTALQMLTAKAAAKPAWAEKFWGQFLNSPSIKLTSLPAPLLDAIQQGVLRMPDGMKTMPKAQQLQAAVADGRVLAASLGKKLNWWKAAKLADDTLDLMDAEKALNIRLTDDRGFPNAMGHAFEAFRNISVAADGVDFMTPASGRVNDVLDNLFDLGLGYSGSTAFAAKLRSDFDAATNGIGVLQGADRNTYTGVGALYHKIDVPTDSEVQLKRFAASRNAARLDELTAGSSEFVNAISGALLQDQIAFSGASRVTELFDDWTKNGNAIQQTTNAHRFQRVIQHAHQLHKMAKAAADVFTANLLTPLAAEVKAATKSPQWPVIAPQLSASHQLISRGFALAEDAYKPGLNAIDISRPGAEHTLAMLGDLAGAPKDLKDWHLFDISIAANEGRYVEVALTQEAAQLLNRYADVSYTQWRAMNALRLAFGAAPIERLRGHLPTMNFNRYKLRYIQDTETGKVIGYIKAKTDKEADRELVAALKFMGDHRAQAGKSPVMEATLSDIKEHFDAADEVFLHSLRDFSGIKQGGTATGRAMDFRLDVSTDLVTDMMIAMRNTFSDLQRRSIAAVMAEPVHEARSMLRRMRGNANGETSKTFFNAIEQWENVLTGDARLPKESFEAKVHATLEDLANAALGKFSETLPYVWRSKLAVANGTATKAEAEFAQKVAANYQPFNQLAQNAELSKYLKLGEAADPYRIATALQAANRATNFILLQYANVAHPLLNYASLAVSSPAVVKFAQPMRGETKEAWALRVGPLADYMDHERGQATFSTGKLLAEAYELMSKDPAAMAAARDRGYLAANFLEELNELNSLRPSKFMDAAAAVGKHADFVNSWLTPLTEKVTGKQVEHFTLSARSEAHTRAWAHMIGYAMVRKVGKEAMTETQKHTFAHMIANQIIADYSPDIRGQAFRGVAGIPFGLFQSYSINLWQRLFGYVENKAARAMATQAATQAAMFGVEGLPGWNQLNALYFHTKDAQSTESGATTLNERIYANFGKGGGDLLMAGSLSNLPKVLNLLPGEQGMGAVNLYTSGDMNLRVTGVPPAVSVMNQFAQGTIEGVRRTAEELPHLFTAEDFDGGRLMEVVANYAPSRGVRSMADLLLGERVDRNGNLVVEETRKGTSLLARALGTKTHDELMVSNAIWSNSQAQRQRYADMDRVRGQILRSIRNGEQTEEQAAYWLADYIAAGGNADQWERWLAYTSDKATMSRGDRAFDKIVTKAGEILPHNYAAVKRLQAAGVKPSGGPMGGVQEPVQ